MSPFREAILLPVLFLTVSLLGGLRVGESVRLLPPPLVALVLAAALLGVLVRAGALDPTALMRASRRPMENLSGAVVLATLFAASAQVFNLLTPERGLLSALFSIYFLMQLMTALAGVEGRDRLLRALTVLFAGAFLLRFAVLESLFASQGGLLKRVMAALVEGISLGAIEYQPHAAITGYAGFFTLVLFLAGLALLPPRRGTRMRTLDVVRTPLPPGPAVVAVLLLGLLTACGGVSARQDDGEDARGGDAARRDGALAAAKVWQPPAVPVGAVDFTANPPGAEGFRPDDTVSCQFVPWKFSGTTPKFHCRLADGRVIKVKYGANAELHSEVAATRLLEALGFAADRMYVVGRVRCAGCPRYPFLAARCAARTGFERLCTGADPSRVLVFEPAVIEQQIDGEAIEAGDDSGWSWFELDRIDPARGGSSRAEVDAFRLMAVLLAHWDNKAANQRLVCPPGRGRPDGRCEAPLAMIQDAGATFGPLKLDLRNWRSTPVWADRASCTVSMETMPYRGSTFPPHAITEAGRRHLADLLAQLSDAQLTDLFTGSRVVSFDHPDAAGRDPGAWVAAMREKIAAIAGGPPCP